MTAGVGIWRCRSCAAALFPQRLLCPHCHGAEFAEERIYEGVVGEIAVIRHMIGQADWQPRRIANIRTTGGPSITVGLIDDAGEGAVVQLFQQDGAPFGKAK